MSYISEIMDKLAAAADALQLYADIVYGSDPPMDGICMIQGSGFPAEKHLNASMLYRLPVLINAKHSSQETAMGALEAIHTALTKTNDFTGLCTDAAQVINVATTASPTVIGREQNSQWICGSSVEVSFYWR